MNEKRYSELVADYKKLLSASGKLSACDLRVSLRLFLARWIVETASAEGFSEKSFMGDVSGIKPSEDLAEPLDLLLSDLLEVVRLRHPGACEALKRAFEKSRELQETAIRYLITEAFYCDGKVSEPYREKKKRNFLDSLAVTNAHRYQAEGPVVHAIQSLARQIADARPSASVKGEFNAD